MKIKIWHGLTPLVNGIIAIAITLVSSGCDKGASRSAESTNASVSTFRVQLPYEPATLDFSLAEDGVALRVLPAMMRGLVTYDRNYGIKLQIADRMERPDGPTGVKYRFRLRPWNWSDGKPVTSSDFAYAMRRTLDPAALAKLSDLLFFIKGARAYKKGELKDFSKVGIATPASDVIEFTLEKPTSFFPHILTLPVAYPQREDIVSRFGAQWVSHMPSTGPYRISKWLRDERIELEQNTTYPGFDPAAPKNLVFEIVHEETTAVTLFENKRLDVLFKAPVLDTERLRKRGLVHDFPYFAVYYLAFDQRKAPWSDRRARKAVAQAINRQDIVQTLAMSERLATSWIPHGIPGFNASVGVKYDPAAAANEWKALGLRDGKSVLGFDSGFRNQNILEKVQADVAKVLGMKLELQNRDWKTYLRDLSSSPPPIYRFGWLSPFVDPYPNLAVFASDSANNYTGWKNAEYDKLLAKIAMLQPGSAGRAKLIDRAHRMLLEQDVVVIPIYHYVQTVVISPRVDGFWTNGIGEVDFQAIRLK